MNCGPAVSVAPEGPRSSPSGTMVFAVYGTGVPAALVLSGCSSDAVSNWVGGALKIGS
jgi:hypothetical protein